jgi:hypothetical protein
VHISAPRPVSRLPACSALSSWPRGMRSGGDSVSLLGWERQEIKVWSVSHCPEVFCHSLAPCEVVSALSLQESSRGWVTQVQDCCNAKITHTTCLLLRSCNADSSSGGVQQVSLGDLVENRGPSSVILKSLCPQASISSYEG